MAAWCRATGEPRGETVSLARVWELAQAWYGDRLADNFRGRTVEQAEAIFRHVGLAGAFWRADG